MMVVRTSLLSWALAGALALAPADKKAPTPELPLFPLGTAWTTPLAAAPAAPPAIDESQIYVPLETGDLAALSIQSGEARWQTRLPTKHAPVAAEGRVIAADEASLEAVRAADGTALWKAPLDSAPVRGLQYRSGWVFVFLVSNDLDAYAAETGQRVWRVALNAPSTTPLVIEGDRVFLGVAGQGIVSLDVMSGERRWQAPLDGDVTAIGVRGDRLFAGTKARRLHAVDARSGRGRWQWRIGGEVVGLDVQPDEVVALMLDQSMRAFKTGDGAQIWREPLNFRPFAGPLRSGSDLVIAGYGPAIRLYATSDGKLRGNYGIPPAAGVQGEATFEALMAAPVIYDPPGFVNDLLILVTQRGTVHAAKRQLMPPLTPVSVVPGFPLPLPAAPEPPAPAPPSLPAPPG
jgi:outer membrane protein assembly factor BamB